MRLITPFEYVRTPGFLIHRIISTEYMGILIDMVVHHPYVWQWPLASQAFRKRNPWCQELLIHGCSMEQNEDAPGIPRCSCMYETHNDGLYFFWHTIQCIQYSTQLKIIRPKQPASRWAKCTGRSITDWKTH